MGVPMSGDSCEDFVKEEHVYQDVQEQQKESSAKCLKCDDPILGDEDSICGGCI